MFRKKRMTIIFAIILLCFCCSGCANIRNYQYNRGVKEKSGPIAEKVLCTITSKDEELLYEMFSQENIKTMKDNDLTEVSVFVNTDHYDFNAKFY